MEYLLKTSIVVALFYFVFYLFLQRDTFFQSNRWFLLIGLIGSFIIPLITIPVYIDKVTTPVQSLVYFNGAAQTTSANPFEVWELLPWIYALGVLFFLTRFIFQVYALGLVLTQNSRKKYRGYSIIQCRDELPPFSFFNWIVYNPDQFDEKELNQIITHEKVHVNQWHSIDILISKITSIILWFNPFIWLYRKSLEQNLEFIADQNTQDNVDCKKSYQYLLLKTGLPDHQLVLTNNFYNSLIKKRIVMLHKKRSKISNQWKFALILPLLTLFLMSFNIKEIVVERPEDGNDLIYDTMDTFHEVHDIIITKDHTEADLDKLKAQLAEDGITVKFKGIKRNSDGEITAIKINVNSEKSNANYNMSSHEPIEPITISIDKESNNISIGNASTLHFGNGYKFISTDGHGKIHKKDSHVMIYSDEDEDHEYKYHEDNEHEHQDVIIIEKDGKVHEMKRGQKRKDIHVITGESNKFIEIDDDADHKVIIEKDGDLVKEMIHDKDVDVKVDGKSVKIKTLGKGKGEKVFFMNTSDKDPIYILDGKKVSKSVVDDLDSDTIEAIEVLKGDSAIEEYGDEAGDGVVKITTKSKKQ
jgi:hypothetical protein